VYAAAHRRTVAAVPSTPSASQRGFRGPAACVCGSSTSPPLRAIRYASRNPTASGPPTRSRFAPSNTRCQFGRPRAVSAPVAPPPSRLSRCLLRSSHFQRPSASRPRTHAAKPTPVEPRTLPDRFVRARLRCSSRASLPLTPQAGTPTATIGMRPATSLRTKTKSVNGLLRAVGSRGFSYASSAARVPTALKMLSQKKCERAFSGR
jgi:hypothetical protein